MATLITPQTLTVVITATIPYTEVEEFKVTNTFTISNVTEVDKRIMPVPLAGEVDIIGVSTAGAIDKGQMTDFDFLIVTNKDDTNFVRLRFYETGGDTVDFRLEAGRSMIFWDKEFEVNTTQAVFGAFVNADTVAAQADTAAVDIEYLICKV